MRLFARPCKCFLFVPRLAVWLSGCLVGALVFPPKLLGRCRLCETNNNNCPPPPSPPSLLLFCTVFGGCGCEALACTKRSGSRCQAAKLKLKVLTVFFVCFGFFAGGVAASQLLLPSLVASVGLCSRCLSGCACAGQEVLSASTTCISSGRFFLSPATNKL